MSEDLELDVLPWGVVIVQVIPQVAVGATLKDLRIPRHRLSWDEVALLQGVTPDE